MIELQYTETNLSFHASLLSSYAAATTAAAAAATAAAATTTTAVAAITTTKAIFPSPWSSCLSPTNKMFIPLRHLILHQSDLN
jgi:hypothetical protein